MSCGRSSYTSTRKLRVREDGAKPSPPRDCKAAPIAREPLSGRVVSGQPDGKAARMRPPSQETGGVCSPRIRSGGFRWDNLHLPRETGEEDYDATKDIGNNAAIHPPWATPLDFFAAVYFGGVRVLFGFRNRGVRA